jgi:hypothetical protein
MNNEKMAEGPKTKNITLKEWLAEGERLFGTDKKQWKWKCLNCGHVQTIADFIELRDKKILSDDFDPGQVVYFSCIGRYDTRIPKEDVGTIWDKKKKSPCNYTLGGLFCFANTYVIDESGQSHPVFDFADVK